MQHDGQAQGTRSLMVSSDISQLVHLAEQRSTSGETRGSMNPQAADHGTPSMSSCEHGADRDPEWEAGAMCVCCSVGSLPAQAAWHGARRAGRCTTV